MRSKVVFADAKLKTTYERLRGSKLENQRLFNWLQRAFDDIAKDAFCGIQIPKNQIPKVYIKKYAIDNLWKYNLPNAWRLIYSVARDEVTVISIILEWFPHKEYERRFNY
jgi:Txe/YoeB family toxin of Txe-Axe toxin-antitoxin module